MVKMWRIAPIVGMILIRAGNVPGVMLTGFLMPGHGGDGSGSYGG